MSSTNLIRPGDKHPPVHLPEGYSLVPRSQSISNSGDSSHDRSDEKDIPFADFTEIPDAESMPFYKKMELLEKITSNTSEYDSYSDLIRYIICFMPTNSKDGISDYFISLNHLYKKINFRFSEHEINALLIAPELEGSLNENEKVNCLQYLQNQKGYISDEQLLSILRRFYALYSGKNIDEDGDYIAEDQYGYRQCTSVRNLLLVGHCENFEAYYILKKTDREIYSEYIASLIRFPLHHLREEVKFECFRYLLLLEIDNKIIKEFITIIPNDDSETKTGLPCVQQFTGNQGNNLPNTLSEGKYALTIKQKAGYLKIIMDVFARYMWQLPQADLLKHLFCFLPTKGAMSGEDLYYILSSFDRISNFNCIGFNQKELLTILRCSILKIVDIPLNSLTTQERIECCKLLVRLGMPEDVVTAFLAKKVVPESKQTKVTESKPAEATESKPTEVTESNRPPINGQPKKKILNILHELFGF